MQRTEGFCIHCSKYVAREQDGTLIAEWDGLATCGDFYEPNPEDHQLDDEEEPEPDTWALDLLRTIFTKTRISLTVEVDLDPVPGWGNVAEDYRALTQRLLDDAIGHYHPVVTIKGV